MNAMGFLYALPFFIIAIITAMFGIECIAEVIEWIKSEGASGMVLVILALSISMIAVAAMCCWMGIITMVLF